MPYKKPYRKQQARRKLPAKDKHIKAVARTEAKKVFDKKIETKFFDYPRQSLVQVDYSGTGGVFGLIDGITQGDTENAVTGSSIIPVGIRINYSWTIADATNMCRCILVQFRGASGASPAVSGILQSVGNLEAPMSTYDSNYNNQYKVLYDRTHMMVNGTTTFKVKGTITVGQSKLRKMDLNFSAGTLSSYETNALYLFCISDSALATHPALSFHSRVYFKDA